MAISFDLKAHDEHFHPNGYVEGESSCKFRERIKEYEDLDDLSDAKGFADSLEDYELLHAMLAEAKDGETKRMLEDQIRDTDGIIAGHVAGAKRKAVASSFGPNAPMPFDANAFPDKADAKWQDALAHYGDRAYGWESLNSGSTAPHRIEFGGRTYYVKKAGYGKSTYTKEAARNEANANRFIRLAGMNAPESMYLKSNDGGRFCVSTESDVSGGTLASRLGDKRVAQQVRDAYPVMSLLYNMDLMQNADNAFVDRNGTVVFLDNGSTFGFSAQGARNKYFDFDKRTDPEGKELDPDGKEPNYLALANYQRNNSGRMWRQAISGGAPIGMQDALGLAAKYEMGALAREAQRQGLLKQMPQNGQDAFIRYADGIDRLSAKYKAKPAVAQPSPAPAATAQSASVQPSASMPGGQGAPVSAAGKRTYRPGAVPSAPSPNAGTQQAGPSGGATPAKYAKAMSRLQAMAARQNATASQKAAAQAMIGRFNSSATI